MDLSSPLIQGVVLAVAVALVVQPAVLLLGHLVKRWVGTEYKLVLAALAVVIGMACAAFAGAAWWGWEWSDGVLIGAIAGLNRTWLSRAGRAKVKGKASE